MYGVTNIFIVIILLLGIIALQVFLSRRENKYLGLIIPFLYFAVSFIGVLLRVSFSELTLYQLLLEDLLLLLMWNIPTLILVVIYVACREKVKKKKELEKMNVQDLD